MVYVPTFTIKINQMWVNISYIDGVGFGKGTTKTWGNGKKLKR